jgi:hypothetical protein
VWRVHLDDLGVRSVGHDLLLGRREHAVGRADEGPGRNGLPGRGAGERLGQRGQGQRPLACGQHCCDLGGNTGCEELGEQGRLDVEVDVHDVAGSIVERDGVDRRVRVQLGSGLRAGELLHRFTLLGDVSVHVDERLHVGVARSGVRDDHAAVGMPDEHDRSGNSGEVVLQVGGV